MRKGYQTATTNYDLLQEFAIKNRNNSTEAERALWQYLKGGVMGVHFRRQHVLLDYIPDFICLSKRLVIEIDGGYHLESEQAERDMARTDELNRMGYKVLRFTNEEVLGDIDRVLETIAEEIDKP
jgi:very-short-patch-repair endonuclease